MEPIRVLLVDDTDETRDNVRRILSFDREVAVIGEARDGLEALQKVQALNPDVVLMDVNMPKLDGIAATERISLEYPGCAVIFLSVQGEPEYLRKAMMAGARDYLVKPFSGDELMDTIKRAYQLETKRVAPGKENKLSKVKPQVVTIFGTKGGVGKTTIAVNLAVLLANTKKKVVIVDLDLQFGDVSVFLNLLPKRTMAELAQEGNNLDIELVESYMIPHLSGIKILPAPGRPEYAELIAPVQMEKVISILKQHYDYVVIDTPPLFNETNLVALDLSTQVFLALSLDLATIKNVKLSLELLDSLHHRGKTKLILNRASEDMGIKISNAEETLDFLIAAQIPSDGKLCVSALNKGIPFVLSDPNARVSQAIRNIADLVIKDKGYQEDLKEQRRGSFLVRLFK
ncbi:response regulator [Thermanaerosceptrum fracticalcis]|uniref:Stage 0 sporulation protein A homolog n=1 Tax=Thermanaerosceptrum fracticalcis TaxID=1712410 RepID=A0A7G6E4B8_THEFR|nr:response regulator [Thermanaerosceptrum fracticalcis]QNB46922.1 response regulator [Thermanaerosceptrum fracticalcis]